MSRLVPWLWRITAAAGLTLLVLTTTARLTLLDSGYDTRAIGAANAYERVYTQVLPSPKVQAAIRQALTGLPVDPTYLTANVRVLLPPPVLEEVVKQAIASYVSTLMGQPPTGDLNIALQPIVDNVVHLVQELAPGAVATAPQLKPGSVTAFDADVRVLIGQLAHGDVDLKLPTVKLKPDNVEQVATILVAGLSPQRAAALRSQISPLLATGDLSGAFALVLPAYLDSAAIRDLRAAATAGASLAVRSMPAGWAGASPHPVLPLGLGWLTVIGLVLTAAGLSPDARSPGNARASSLPPWPSPERSYCWSVLSSTHVWLIRCRKSPARATWPPRAGRSSSTSTPSCGTASSGSSLS